jgi:pyrroloquinoline quinone (PQQ) biosynthesis protein C
MTQTPRDYKRRVLELYDLFPFHQHPLWQAIINGELTLKQVINAEKQHYLRTKAGQQLRQQSAQYSRTKSPKIFEAALSNYLEEVAPDQSHPSHLELIKRLLNVAGVTDNQLRLVRPTPGNSAAMALYKDIADRGAANHLVGAGAVEFHYSMLAPKIFHAYTTIYGMTEFQAETYKLHGPMDKSHADRALSVLQEAVEINGWPVIESSVRDAFVATSLHYDGMLQAALNRMCYWNGEKV